MARGIGGQRGAHFHWLAGFDEPELTRTVNEALTYNRNLKVAAARLREVRESSIIARSQMLPSVGLSGGTAVTDSADSDSRQSQSLNLAAAWEPDLWERLRKSNEGRGTNCLASPNG